MIRKTVFLFSLVAVLLLAGLCSCKQEVTPEKPAEMILDSALIESETISEGTSSATLNAGLSGVNIPSWEISKSGYQNIPAAVTSGSVTGVSKALKAGLKNPPEFKSAKNLIVIVCEGMTSELIESSTTQYGELILNSFPVKGATLSKFTDADGKLLTDYIANDLFKTKIGISSWGEISANSMRRMTTHDDNEVSKADVSFNQFNPIEDVSGNQTSSRIAMTVGKGDFSKVHSDADQTNQIYKSSAVINSSLKDAISLYKKEDVYFYLDEKHNKYESVNYLYTIFENDSTLPSFRQEAAFALAWMQSIMDDDGFALLLSYSPSSALDANGVQDFDEGVAVAVKYVLENPDTALLICGCPIDGSVSDVCFYGIGKGVSAQSTLYECVSSLY